MRYLQDEPISLTISKGVVVYLSCDEMGPDGKGNFRFDIDMRPLVKAVPVEKLPRGLTRRMIPEICRSKTSETYSDNYMSVAKVIYSIAF